VPELDSHAEIGVEATAEQVHGDARAEAEAESLPCDGQAERACFALKTGTS
jgi:hypothetical protein